MQFPVEHVSCNGIIRRYHRSWYVWRAHFQLQTLWTKLRFCLMAASIQISKLNAPKLSVRPSQIHFKVGVIFFPLFTRVQSYMTYGNNLYIKHRCRCFVIQKIYVARENSVGIATRYELNGPGIENLCGHVFFVSIQTGHGVHPASFTMRIGPFLGVRRPGRGVTHPPSSSNKVKERAELHFYCPSVP